MLRKSAKRKKMLKWLNTSSKRSSLTIILSRLRNGQRGPMIFRESSLLGPRNKRIAKRKFYISENRIRKRTIQEVKISMISTR